MSTSFVVVYYNVDEVKNSEVGGVYPDKDTAVKALVKAAHYDEKNGKLRQYRRESSDYKSYQEVVEKANNDMELVDYDIYRIETVVI